MVGYILIIFQLGIREIFTSDASLPLLARGAGLQNKLYVTNIIQKAGIQIDEEGSIVHAATEISFGFKLGVNGPLEFIADHPFIFVIQDETTGALLFAGKVTNPAAISVTQ